MPTRSQRVSVSPSEFILWWYNCADKGARLPSALKGSVLFFFQWDQGDFKHLGAIAAYMLVGAAGIVYKLLNSGDLETFLSGLADVGGAVFIVGLVIEGGVWIMVMALGKLSEARRRGREEGHAEGLAKGLEEGRAEGLAEGLEEGREKMARAMREIGRPETEIQQALDRFDNRRNGERER